MALHVDDVCVAKVTVPGNWPLWYLATIIAFDEDAKGNWEVLKFRVVGEAFIRDVSDGMYVIHGDEKQAQAQKLARQTWTPKPYKDLDEVRAAINGVWL